MRSGAKHEENNVSFPFILRQEGITYVFKTLIPVRNVMAENK